MEVIGHALHSLSRQVVHSDFIQLDVGSSIVLGRLRATVDVAMGGQIESQQGDDTKKDSEDERPGVEDVRRRCISDEDVADPIQR